MTFYPGGKKRLGFEIAESISSYSSKYKNLNSYYEPFCGMLGVYRYIPDLLKVKNYYASDQNQNVITLWHALQRGWKPPTEPCSKSTYQYDKETNNKSLRSIFYGFACSYRGDFRSGYFDKNNIKTQAADCVEIGQHLSIVDFSCGSFDEYLPKGCIIYCDPPYRDTKNNYYDKNKRNAHFDYDAFISWCKTMSRHNLIFISEYSKPCREAKLIWSNGKEKLYVLD